MWRRSGVPAASLVELAEADAFLPSLGLQRRDALWAIKALRDEPLPLFAAASEREARAIAEQQEPEVALRQMTDGHNVVQDYSHIGLTLRQHPVAFLRKALAERQIVTCAQAMNARDGRWLMTAGLVLVRQRPGSAKGVIFMTIEDETGPANVVVWPKLFEQRRRIILGASMIAINGRIQREGDVVHLVAQQAFDLSGDLCGLAERDAGFRLPTGRGDEFAHGSPGSPDSRDRVAAARPRDIFIPLCRTRHNGMKMSLAFTAATLSRESGLPGDPCANSSPLPVGSRNSPSRSASPERSPDRSNTCWATRWTTSPSR
jgi:error-prone DNA polymerase